MLNDRLMAVASSYAKAQTKRGVVEEALQVFVDVRASEQRRALYRDRLAELRPRLDAIRLPDSSRDLIRTDRERA